MCGGFVKDTEFTARKFHRCCACSVLIPPGSRYVKSFYVDGGDVDSGKWHLECLKEFERGLRENGDDCGDPWSTWENDMPPEIQRNYIYGPIENA